MGARRAIVVPSYLHPEREGHAPLWQYPATAGGSVTAI
jgi:hypothetical protein